MFSRNKTERPDAADAVTPAADIEQAGPLGKGRPTPRRAQSEAANKRPLVPSDRKAATRAARETERAKRARAYQGMQAGDERYLQPRDKGPQRRYVRDYVDARWNLGDFFLPVAFVLFALNFMLLRYPQFASIVLLGIYVVVLLVIADVVVMWLRLKRKLRAKFGEVQRGTAMYAAMRVFQVRRSRMPRPNHKKRGVWPA